MKFLMIIDEYNHYCLDIVASRLMGAHEVIAALTALIGIHGGPLYLRCDKGGEFIAHIVRDWLAFVGIQTRFIEPGCPWQNGVNESFNGRFRDECLNRELLANLLEAQCVARAFRDEYNHIRPHSSIGYSAPSNIAPNFWAKLQAPVGPAKPAVSADAKMGHQMASKRPKSGAHGPLPARQMAFLYAT